MTDLSSDIIYPASRDSTVTGPAGPHSCICDLPTMAGASKSVVSLAVALLFATGALAAGGAGGEGAVTQGDPTLGGAGGSSTAVNGAPGETGSQVPFRAGGGGGGGAVDRNSGAGGAGGVGGTSIGPVAPMLAAAPGGGGGAAGSAGIVANGIIGSSVVGGNGVNGGDAPGVFLDVVGGGGGGGGEGGIGAWTPGGATATIANGVSVQGGAGGRGGLGGVSNDGVPDTVGSGGGAGDGGIGIYIGPGAQVTNLGIVEGGRGGTGGGIGGKIVVVEKPAVAGVGGAGGVGIEAEGGTIFNSGTVRGGLDAAGTSRAAAIFFRSGTSLLELRAGSNIDGLIHIGGFANARIFAAAPDQKIFGGLLVDGAGILDSGTQLLEVNSTIQGAGLLDIQGSGTVLLSTPANFVGVTTVAGGTFRAGAANVFAPASPHTVLTGGVLDTGGFNQTLQSLNNAGVVSLVGSAPGSTLTVTNAYVGNGGTLRLGTTLGGSASPSDRLVLDGPAASASGSTQVEIRNIGGLGALTAGNGIEVISGINGATTTAQTTRNAFRLAGDHVDAGAFEYRLQAADANGLGENWYLRSTVSVPTILFGNPSNPSGPGSLGGSGIPPDLLDPTSPSFSPGLVSVLLGAGLGNIGFGSQGLPLAANATGFNQVPAYRIEAGLLSSLPQQLRQSSFAMLGNLHRRIG
ncbi:MAG: autotransporter outer membrane beta-barrel domain-containing protein, partial [Gammaproteobacteria bacterium]|nr:autotransporter outer membrane beta-barrel domain-containing protein [Gammaproteobacteria bacterium]